MIIVITGPTCMGKSETALEIAKAINVPEEQVKMVLDEDPFEVVAK